MLAFGLYICKTVLIHSSAVFIVTDGKGDCGARCGLTGNGIVHEEHVLFSETEGIDGERSYLHHILDIEQRAVLVGRADIRDIVTLRETVREHHIALFIVVVPVVFTGKGNFL